MGKRRFGHGIAESLEGREEFVRAHAMDLLRERDEKITRMRRRIVQLEKVARSRLEALRKLRDQSCCRSGK